MLLIFGKLGLHFVLSITIIMMQTRLKTTRQISVCTILCAMTLGTNSAWYSPLAGARHASDGRLTTSHRYDTQVPGRSWSDRRPPHSSRTAPVTARSSSERPVPFRRRARSAAAAAPTSPESRRSQGCSDGPCGAPALPGPATGLPRSPCGTRRRKPRRATKAAAARPAPFSRSGPTSVSGTGRLTSRGRRRRDPAALRIASRSGTGTARGVLLLPTATALTGDARRVRS